MEPILVNRPFKCIFIVIISCWHHHFINGDVCDSSAGRLQVNRDCILSTSDKNTTGWEIIQVILGSCALCCSWL